jgi:hypothetical protein
VAVSHAVYDDAAAAIDADDGPDHDPAVSPETTD